MHLRMLARAYYADRFGPLEANILEELMAFPLVHISIPPYVVTKAKENREYAKEIYVRRAKPA